MLLSLTLSIFACTIAAQSLLARSRVPGSGVVKYAALTVFAQAALAFLSLSVMDSLFEILTCLLLLGFLCELYMFFFTLVSSSISVTLLRKLRQRAMRAAEIECLYDSKGMVDKRLERMRSVGLLDRESAAATPRGRRLVWAFSLLRGAFRLDAPFEPSRVGRAA